MVVAHLLEVDGADGVIRLLVSPQTPGLLLQQRQRLQPLTTALTTASTVPPSTRLSTGPSTRPSTRPSTGGPQTGAGGHGDTQLGLPLLLAAPLRTLHLASLGRQTAARHGGCRGGAATVPPRQQWSRGPWSRTVVRGGPPVASTAHSRHMRRKRPPRCHRPAAICPTGTVL